MAQYLLSAPPSAARKERDCAPRDIREDGGSDILEIACGTALLFRKEAIATALPHAGRTFTDYDDDDDDGDPTVSGEDESNGNIKTPRRDTVKPSDLPRETRRDFSREYSEFFRCCFPAGRMYLPKWEIARKSFVEFYPQFPMCKKREKKNSR